MPSALHPTNAASPLSSSGYGDTTAQFRELISGCGIYDLRGRAKIVLTGDDRVRWLNGMITNNVRDLTKGRGVYAFMLNPQGRIQADLYAFLRDDSILVDVDGELREKLLGLFDHYIIADDVNVEDVSSKLSAIGVTGPKGREVLARVGIDVSSLEPLQLVDRDSEGISITVVTGGEESAPTWQMWSSPENFSKLWNRLVESGAKIAETPALELFRIARGIPRYGQDIRERDLPQETRQDRALHFTKGCYVGQEIVERIRSRGAVHRLFSGFTVNGPLPEIGTPIRAEGKDVGEVTSAVVLPFEKGDSPAALGYVRREVMSGKALKAGESGLTVSALPFREPN